MESLPGICAGIAQTIVGHPIDTMKVLIQSRKPWLGLSIRDYYRGTKYPFIISIISNSLVFPCETWIYSHTESHIISGGISGIFITPFIYTLENIKLKYQLKQPITLDVLLYRNAFFTTLFRESLAMSIYFSSYHYARSYDINSFLSGCISGIANWGITYPLDVIRTRQIGQNISFQAAYQQRKIWKGLGIVLGRAVLVNGSIFYTHDKVSQLIQ